MLLEIQYILEAIYILGPRIYIIINLIWHITFLALDHEIISMVIHHLPVIEEGQLSVTGKRMHTKYW